MTKVSRGFLPSGSDEEDLVFWKAERISLFAPVRWMRQVLRSPLITSDVQSASAVLIVSSLPAWLGSVIARRRPFSAAFVNFVMLFERFTGIASWRRAKWEQAQARKAFRRCGFDIAERRRSSRRGLPVNERGKITSAVTLM